MLQRNGYWWIPGTNADQVGGILTSSQGPEIELELFGTLGSSSFGSSPQPSKRNLILGKTTNNDLVTLTDCLQSGSSHKHNLTQTTSTEKYKPSRIYIGKHISSTDPRFHSVKVMFDGIKSWVGYPMPQLDIAQSNPPYQSSGDKHKITYETPKSTSGRISDFEISISPHLSTAESTFESAKIAVQPFFRIKSRWGTEPYSKYREGIRKLQNFVTFGIGESIRPTAVTGRIDHSTWGDRLAKRGAHSRNPPNKHIDIDIYDEIIIEKDNKRTSHSQSMNFDLNTIRSQFGSTIRKWYDQYESLKSVFDLYFSATHSNQLYVQNEFLTYCRAIEKYHHEMYDDQYIHPHIFSLYKQGLDEILEGDLGKEVGRRGTAPSGLVNSSDKYNLGRDFKSHLKDGTFNFANEYSLRKRIKELNSDLNPILVGLPLTPLNHSSLIADTRNYYTHYNDDLQKKAAHGSDLVELTYRVRQLVEVCLFDSIGFSRNHIRDRIDSRYGQIKFS